MTVQYKCLRCQEPVSNEIQPVLEAGTVLICPKCILNWALRPTPQLEWIDLTDYKALDTQMANELEAQFTEVRK